MWLVQAQNDGKLVDVDIYPGEQLVIGDELVHLPTDVEGKDDKNDQEYDEKNYEENDETNNKENDDDDDENYLFDGKYFLFITYFNKYLYIFSLVDKDIESLNPMYDKQLRDAEKDRMAINAMKRAFSGIWCNYNNSFHSSSSCNFLFTF